MGSLCRQPVRLGQRRHLCSAAEAPAAKAPSGFTQWCAANPIKFGVGVATVKTAAADLLTQKAIEGKAWDSIDWRRNGLFTVFGFAYQVVRDVGTVQVPVLYGSPRRSTYLPSPRRSTVREAEDRYLYGR